MHALARWRRHRLASSTSGVRVIYPAVTWNCVIAQTIASLCSGDIFTRTWLANACSTGARSPTGKARRAASPCKPGPPYVLQSGSAPIRAKAVSWLGVRKMFIGFFQLRSRLESDGDPMSPHALRSSTNCFEKFYVLWICRHKFSICFSFAKQNLAVILHLQKKAGSVAWPAQRVNAIAQGPFSKKTSNP